MTTATANTTVLEGLVESCRKAWNDALSRVVAPCTVQVVAETAPLPETPICVMLTAEGAISGPAAVVMDQRNAAFLAEKLGGNAAASQSVLDLIRQTIVMAINEFQKQFGPTKAHFTAGAALNWQPETVLTLVAGGGNESLRAHLLLSPQISSGVPGASAARPATEALTRDLQGQNLHLLMGVELEVTLRFGQRKLPLRQLVELGAGAVVELDRRVQEPVELLLRDKVIARGEVVIVEGNYGLRVSEICALPTQ